MIVIVVIKKKQRGNRQNQEPETKTNTQVYAALVYGIKNYVRKEEHTWLSVHIDRIM